MAPINFAGQPVTLATQLRNMGLDIRFLQYQYGAGKFQYATDMVIDLTGRNRSEVQFEVLRNMLQEGVDIFHFWQRSLFFASGYRNFPGLDLILIKNRGRKIIHRFTGYDVRFASEEIRVNPYNAYRYGLQRIHDENAQRKYVDYLRNYVDLFLVQDIELQSYFPEAKIIPRAIDLDHWPFRGPSTSDLPLVIHAPSKTAIKGTDFVLKVVEDLRAEGLKFDFKLIQDLPHREAMNWYEKADIAIDQLHVGWYGVFAMECMALGKPVMVYIREDLWEIAQPRLAVVNTNPDTVKDELRALIKDFEKRRELGMEARKYVEEVHDVRKVAEAVLGIYRDVMSATPKGLSEYTDLDYCLFQLQTMRNTAETQILRYKARRFDELREEIASLRSKATEYDKARDELPTLRYKVRRYEELLQEAQTLRDKAWEIDGRYLG